MHHSGNQRNGGSDRRILLNARSEQRIKLQPKMADALRSAGATEEIVALMQSCFDACIKPGRPRQYPDRAAKQRAYRARRKQREKDHAPLRQRLEEAGQANFDARVSIEPIRRLIEQGCDLEADILPVIAREVPELPRLLRSWAAKWVVEEILTARDRMIAGRLVPAFRPS
jgi:hypothetical protein